MVTSDELRSWQARMGLSALQASKRLGVSYATYRQWIAGFSRNGGRPIALPPLLPLACAALEAGLQPVGDQPRSSPSISA